MGFSGARPKEDIEYTICQCKHCGDWLNKQGFVDLSRTPKIKTSKKVYCDNCKTAKQRRDMDIENEKILSKK